MNKQERTISAIKDGIIEGQKETITELRNVLMDLLTHVEPLWNDRVKDGELELTVSAEDVEDAIKALRKTEE